MTADELSEVLVGRHSPSVDEHCLSMPRRRAGPSEQ
jgi:hypothetical protein